MALDLPFRAFFKSLVLIFAISAFRYLWSILGNSLFSYASSLSRGVEYPDRFERFERFELVRDMPIPERPWDMTGEGK